MLTLPFEIIQIIINNFDIKTKLNIKSLNKYLYHGINIYTFYDYVFFKFDPCGLKYLCYYDIVEFPNILHKLTGHILTKYIYIKELNLVNDNIISDNEIKHLKNLCTLYVNSRISDWRSEVLNI